MHLADTAQQRETLKDLVEAYGGMLLYKSGTSFNAVRHHYGRLAEAPHSRYIVQGYIRHMAELCARMGRLFPDRYAEARKTLEGDIGWMKEAFASKYGEVAAEGGGPVTTRAGNNGGSGFAAGAEGAD